MDIYQPGPGIGRQCVNRCYHIPVSMVSPVFAEPLTSTIRDTNGALWGLTMYIFCIKYKTWDKRKCSLFTVDKSGYFSNDKVYEERYKVKINKYVYFHSKCIALTQPVLHVLEETIFMLFANLFS